MNYYSPSSIINHSYYDSYYNMNDLFDTINTTEFDYPINDLEKQIPEYRPLAGEHYFINISSDDAMDITNMTEADTPDTDDDDDDDDNYDDSDCDIENAKVSIISTRKPAPAVTNIIAHYFKQVLNGFTCLSKTSIQIHEESLLPYYRKYNDSTSSYSN